MITPVCFNYANQPEQNRPRDSFHYLKLTSENLKLGRLNSIENKQEIYIYYDGTKHVYGLFRAILLCKLLTFHRNQQMSKVSVYAQSGYSALVKESTAQSKQHNFCVLTTEFLCNFFCIDYIKCNWLDSNYRKQKNKRAPFNTICTINLSILN